jgi:hypothetical protein
MDEQSAKAHKEVCELWGRYQDTAKSVYSLQATVAELVSDTQKAGQKIYQLYKLSGDGLDGSPSESA